MKSLDEIILDAAAYVNISSPSERRATHVEPEPREHGCPVVFQNATLDEPEWCERIQCPQGPKGALESILAQSSRAVLWGPPGSGKSTLASLVFRTEEKRHGVRAKWISHEDIEAAARWGRIQEGFPVELSLLFRCPFLVIDGLKSKPWGHSVSHIINKRYDNGRLPTLITTEYSLEELAPGYEGGTLRRLYRDSLVIRMGA